MRHEKRPRAWGKMTAHEMLCHLNDSFVGVMGERPISSIETWSSRTIVKYIALHTNFAWPKGTPTRPEVDQTKGGTKPISFERDREQTIALLRRECERQGVRPIAGCWYYNHRSKRTLERAGMYAPTRLLKVEF